MNILSSQMFYHVSFYNTLIYIGNKLSIQYINLEPEKIQKIQKYQGRQIQL